MSEAPIIVWLRHDLRLQDNPALYYAAQENRPLIFLYIFEEGLPFPLGAASKWWLHYSLEAFSKSIHPLSSLIIKKGKAESILLEMSKEVGATHVYWNRRYEPHYRDQDIHIEKNLHKHAIITKTFCGNLLIEPTSLLNRQGKPYQMFTPFYKAALLKPASQEIVPISKVIQKYKKKIETLTIHELQLLPSINWAKGLVDAWTPGEQGAKKQLDIFIETALFEYECGRNFPSKSGTSRLSPHLHFGEISVRQIVKRIEAAVPYIRELYWREFANHLLFYFPDTPTKPLHKEFNHFPWKKNKVHLHAWQKGMTGYPIVDAGMRQLWQTGWMHGRLRMIVGSFLVKDLLIPWQEGAEWFWDTLVDADLANNTLGWQWIGGCGADASPYFRIFNPILQGKKFDPNGEYIKQYIPELAQLPSKYIHAPWEVDSSVLQKYGVELGKNYPYPIVDHNNARKRALDAFSAMRIKH